MNEIKSYLLQLDEEKYPGSIYRWDWEIKLAIGADGNYFGKAKCHMHSNADSYPWVETKMSDFEEALEFMRKYCERQIPR
jgi:hypothetical protein